MDVLKPVTLMTALPQDQPPYFKVSMTVIVAKQIIK